MVKFEKASDDVMELFEKVSNGTNIPKWIRFEVLCNNDLKGLYKIVKMNDLVEILTNGLNFAIILNEEIFDGLSDEQKEMAIQECLAGILVSESEKITLEKPNFNTYTGMLEKYGHEPIIILHESIKSLLDQKKQKEDEEKANKKSGRNKT